MFTSVHPEAFEVVCAQGQTDAAWRHAVYVLGVGVDHRHKVWDNVAATQSLPFACLHFVDDLRAGGEIDGAHCLIVELVVGRVIDVTLVNGDTGSIDHCTRGRYG